MLWLKKSIVEMLKWDGCGNNFLTETRVKVATVATVVDGCENNDPGLFFNRLIIYTSVVNHNGSDSSENNDSLELLLWLFTMHSLGEL